MRAKSSQKKSTRVWTVGHSTRSADEFSELLLAHNINMLVDVRSFPGSRRFPQFNQKRLAGDLAKRDVVYHHLPALGGRRKPNPKSQNTAWKHPSFRAYADHMETAEFNKGIGELLKSAKDNRVALMCAEALWWKCHRSLIADYLKAGGVEVIHILASDKTEIHPYTAAAKIIDGRLSYKGLMFDTL